MAETVGVPLAALDERIGEIRVRLSQIQELKIELKMIESLLVRAAELSGGGHLGPRRAVTETLKRLSCTQADLVAMLHDSVKTRSKNAKRVLHTTIGQLRKEGRITERNGRLTLVEA